MRNEIQHARLTQSIIGAFYEVYNILGYGWLEHVYLLALEWELRERGHQVGREVGVDVWYKGMRMGVQRLDLVVDGLVVIELKATETLAPAAKRQLLNYLRCTSLEVGLLLHFGPDPRVHRAIHNRKGRRRVPAAPADPR